MRFFAPAGTTRVSHTGVASVTLIFVLGQIVGRGPIYFLAGIISASIVMEISSQMHTRAVRDAVVLASDFGTGANAHALISPRIASQER